MKHLLISIAIGFFRVLTALQKFTVRFFRILAAIIWWPLAKLGRLPLFLIYSLHLKTRFRLASLGIHIKNPFLYPFVSNSFGFFVIGILVVGVAFANLTLQEQNADVLAPTKLLAYYVVNDDNSIFVEDSLASLEQGTNEYIPRSGVRADYTEHDPGVSGGANFGDIAQSTGALIKPVLPGTTTQPPATNGIRTYIVKDGDTLSSIAQQFGLRSDTIATANNISAAAPLRVGRSLTILPVNGILYRVQRGDTLIRIAEYYNTDMEEVIAQNSLAGVDDLRADEVIVLPGGSIPQRSTAVAKGSKGVISSITNIFGKKPKEKSPQTIGKTIVGFIWPTSARRISQYFSWAHTGIDIAGPTSNKIYAAGDGVVVISTSGWNGGYGNTVVIDHGNGRKTRYGHASKLYVKKGERVSRGEVIGMVGNTGRSTGPHLHFELLVNNKRVNPLSAIR